MEKILAETPFFHRQLKILIGSRDHAHVDCNFTMAAQTEIRSAVQNAQQFHLDLRLQLANLIEKNRALVGQFKQAGLRGIGAAEGALLVAEQFTLHQMFGQGGAIDIHQCIFVPKRGSVDGACN